MLSVDQKDPKQMADHLLQEAGVGASVHAALEAEKAILSKNTSACLYWREVIKIIDHRKLD